MAKKIFVNLKVQYGVRGDKEIIQPGNVMLDEDVVLRFERDCPGAIERIPEPVIEEKPKPTKPAPKVNKTKKDVTGE